MDKWLFIAGLTDYPAGSDEIDENVTMEVAFNV